MRCENCGNEIDPNWKICHHCGKSLIDLSKLNDNSNNIQVQTTSVVPTKPVPATESQYMNTVQDRMVIKTKSKKPFIILSITCVALILLGGFLFYILSIGGQKIENYPNTIGEKTLVNTPTDLGVLLDIDSIDLRSVGTYQIKRFNKNALITNGKLILSLHGNDCNYFKAGSCEGSTDESCRETIELANRYYGEGKVCTYLEAKMDELSHSPNDRYDYITAVDLKDGKFNHISSIKSNSSTGTSLYQTPNGNVLYYDDTYTHLIDIETNKAENFEKGMSVIDYANNKFYLMPTGNSDKTSVYDLNSMKEIKLYKGNDFSFSYDQFNPKDIYYTIQKEVGFKLYKNGIKIFSSSNLCLGIFITKTDIVIGSAVYSDEGKNKNLEKMVYTRLNKVYPFIRSSKTVSNDNAIYGRESFVDSNGDTIVLDSKGIYKLNSKKIEFELINTNYRNTVTTEIYHNFVIYNSEMDVIPKTANLNIYNTITKETEEIKNVYFTSLDRSEGKIYYILKNDDKLELYYIKID